MSRRVLAAAMSAALLGSVALSAAATDSAPVAMAVSGQGNIAISTDYLTGETPTPAEAISEDAVQPFPDSAEFQSNIPNEVRALILDIYQQFDVASFVWEDATQELAIWLEPDEDLAEVNKVIAAAGIDGISADHAAFAQYEFDEIVEAIATGEVATRLRVAWVAPTADRSNVVISPYRPVWRVDFQESLFGDIDTTFGLPDSSFGISDSASMELPLPAGTIIGHFNDIPIVLGEYSDLAHAQRNQPETDAVVGGALITRRLGRRSVTQCTSAFSVTNTINGQHGILTADHCARENHDNRDWYSGLLGAAIGSHPAELPELSQITGDFGNVPEITDAVVIQSSDALAAMYWGEPDDPHLAPVTGYFPPVIGEMVIHNGQPSGMVTQNRIMDTGVTFINSEDLIYRDLVRTVQIDGIPAAGNGDSGGPVFTVAPDGSAYAIGIISGINNARRTCSGTPGSATRLCSSVVFFAPIGPALANSDYQIASWNPDSPNN